MIIAKCAARVSIWSQRIRNPKISYWLAANHWLIYIHISYRCNIYSYIRRTHTPCLYCISPIFFLHLFTLHFYLNHHFSKKLILCLCFSSDLQSIEKQFNSILSGELKMEVTSRFSIAVLATFSIIDQISNGNQARNLKETG